MRSGCKGAACAAAIGLLVFSGAASASPLFRTVVLDDFSGFERDQRWTAQIGSGGHVAYLTRDDAQLRLWDGTATEVLHEIGTHIEGLAPGVTTDSLSPGSFGSRHHGRILGVDREGGVSVYLYAGPEPGLATSFLAATVPGGGFRAIMVPPEFAAQTGVVRSRLGLVYSGMRRCDAGYTRASGVHESGVFSHRIFSPDLSERVLWSFGDQIPGGTTATGLTYLIADSSFGVVGHFDHAGTIAASLVRFTADGGQTFDNGVLRTHDAGAEMLLRSGAPMNDLQLPSGGKPLVRVNTSGQTLVSTMRVVDSVLGTHLFEPLLLYSETGDVEMLLQRNDSIPFTNFQPRPYDPRFNDRIHRRMAFAEDGSMIFDISPTSSELARRSPSGEYTMLLAPNAELLGVPGAAVGFEGRPMVSLDGTSAAAAYRINGAETVFYAGPAGLTRILGVGDEVEVAPGEFRTATQVFLLDVNAEHVLLNVTYQGGRAMLAATVPACRADLNNDGVVDADDFFLFLQYFAAGDPRADINGDGVIDADDFFDYLALFAQGC